MLLCLFPFPFALCLCPFSLFPFPFLSLLAPLYPVSREPLPRIVEPPGPAIAFGLLLTYRAPQIEQRFVDKRTEPRVLVEAGVRQEPADDRAPNLEPGGHVLEMDARAMERPEVRQEQRVGFPRQNSILARAPGVQVDIGGRRR